MAPGSDEDQPFPIAVGVKACKFCGSRNTKETNLTSYKLVECLNCRMEYTEA